MSDNKVPAAAMDISAQPAPAGAARKKGTSPPALSSLPDAVRQAIAAGDFKHCTDAEREQYIEALCATIGISPISRPFGWLKQPTRGGNHNLVCYALKDATEQLRSLRQVSLSILRCEPVADVMMVHVRATLPAVHGQPVRSDEDVGAVWLGDISGEQRANAIMRAITKAKRRATLSVCGLGVMDESEVASTPALPGPAAEVSTAGALVSAAPPSAPTAPVLPAPPPALASPPDGAAKAERGQLDRLRMLKDKLQVTAEAWAKTLARRGVQVARDLTQEQAAALIQEMERAIERAVNGRQQTEIVQEMQATTRPGAHGGGPQSSDIPF
jgi:hypothetical protein